MIKSPAKAGFFIGGSVLSNSQIDKLGSQLRKGEMSVEILEKLEVFRSMHSSAYRYVENVLVETMGLQVTGRPFKSTVAIVEKLRRETIRLNQIQDISGCRVLVDNLAEQDHLIDNMSIFFAPLDVQIDDKRAVPTNGYRAIHVVIKKEGRPVEIQVRTRIQHAWAELSEKLADSMGHSIKYGQGDKGAISFLSSICDISKELEEVRHKRMYNTAVKLSRGSSKTLKLENKSLMEMERALIRRLRSLFKYGEEVA